MYASKSGPACREPYPPFHHWCLFFPGRDLRGIHNREVWCGVDQAKKNRHLTLKQDLQWLLQFNATKCVVLWKSAIRYAYTLNGTQLSEVK